MKYRLLGDTDLRVSEIGLGTWSMGGHWWGAMDDRAAIATIHRALELGVNLIDTADIYGFGHCDNFDRSFNSFKEFAKFYLSSYI